VHHWHNKSKKIAVTMSFSISGGERGDDKKIFCASILRMNSYENWIYREHLVEDMPLSSSVDSEQVRSAINSLRLRRHQLSEHVSYPSEGSVSGTPRSMSYSEQRSFLKSRAEQTIQNTSLPCTEPRIIVNPPVNTHVPTCSRIDHESVFTPELRLPTLHFSLQKKLSVALEHHGQSIGTAVTMSIVELDTILHESSANFSQEEIDKILIFFEYHR
jgi:hypothetical protein